LVAPGTRPGNCVIPVVPVTRNTPFDREGCSASSEQSFRVNALVIDVRERERRAGPHDRNRRKPPDPPSLSAAARKTILGAGRAPAFRTQTLVSRKLPPP
jgi:hypothetical protein